MAKCGACNETVVWRLSEQTNKRAPINSTPDPKGNVTINADGAYKVLTKAEIEELEGGLFGQANPPIRYTSHFATCEKASQFRSGSHKS